MEPAYYTNFGGAVLRYGEVPGAIGALESPDNHMPIGMVFPIGWTAEGLAAFRLQVYKADHPGRWVCFNRWFVRGVSRAGGPHRDQGRRADSHRQLQEDRRPAARATRRLAPVSGDPATRWAVDPFADATGGSPRSPRVEHVRPGLYTRVTLRRHPRAVHGVEGAPDAPARL
jgi:hypothetical protein